MKGAASVMAGGVLVLVALASCSDLPQAPSPGGAGSQGGAQISAYADLAGFEAAARRLDTIDFEDQPRDARSDCTDPDLRLCTPIDNPLVIQDVAFTDPFALQTGFCSSPTCEPAGIVLGLSPGGTIDFPPNTGGALLVIQGIGDIPFQIRATDGLGGTRTIDGVGVSFGTAYAGFGSPAGITRIEVLSVGGTGGPLGIASVIFSRRLPI